MRIRPIAAVLLRQYFLVRGSLSRLFPLFVWVAIDMVLWGFITRYLDALTASTNRFVPSLLGAVLFWDFQTRVMQGVTMAFFEDVWSRNFLNVFASPMTLPEYLTGLVLSAVATSLIGLVVMWLVATLVFGLSLFTYGAMLLPFMGVLFLFGIALGIVGSGIVLRLGPAAEWFVWPIPAVISPFAAVYYPLHTLPAWMQAVSRALPPSYVFEGMRTLVTGGHVSWHLLGVGALLAVVDVLLAAWLFTRIHRYAVRTGLIARYSAESVS